MSLKRKFNLLLNAMKIIFYILIPITSIINAAGQVFLKLGAEKLSLKGGIIEIVKSGWQMIVGMFFFVLTFALSTILNKKFDVSLIYPIMTGLSFIFISLIMVVFLKKEGMSLLKSIGMFVIISGILLMSMSQRLTK